MSELQDLIDDGTIPSGTPLPPTGTEGDLFFLTTGVVGLYLYHLSAWALICPDENINTLRNSILIGSVPGWNITPGGPDLSQPAYVDWIKDNERIHGVMTWGVDGVDPIGSINNIITSEYQYSKDGGSTWDLLGIVDYTYGITGNLESAIWRP